MTREEALEQEPCEDWYDVPSDEMTLGQARRAVKDLRKKLSEQIEQEPKTGRWIRVDKDKCKCDQCEVISFIAMYPNGDINWCPNCGAKMQEVKNDTN